MVNAGHCSPLRILFLADTHLGFDLPLRPRVERRRRGPDFFANTERALQPALRGEVDAVVHGGDLLYRSRVPPQLVDMAFAPLKRVADTGVPVFLVPGNHERSHIPHALLALHENIHIFDQPRTFVLTVRGLKIAFSGFPFIGEGIQQRFGQLCDRTQALGSHADIRLLCMHECVEGASVGPSDFMFRAGPNVVRATDVPDGFAAILSGHIHRAQTLTSDGRGRPLRAPVLYPGSIERTSLAEKDETKGYLQLAFGSEGTPGGKLLSATFVPLPARPMVLVQIHAGRDVAGQVREAIARAPRDAVLSLRVLGTPSAEELRVLSAPALRALAPATTNVSVSLTCRAGYIAIPS